MCVGTAWASVNIIPKPTSVTELEGSFQLRDGLTIGYNDAALAPAATYLQEMLVRATGFSIKTGKKGKIQLTLEPSPNPSNQGEELESYELVCDKKGVQIKAPDYRGIINGIATLRQLLPNAIETPYDSRWSMVGSTWTMGKVAWTVPAVRIQDSPNFHWRGLMLDPVRHFYSVDETKRLLDEMALYKLNKFHWHLSDNEGFRMEVKAFPGLTSDTVAWRLYNGHDRECLNRASKENNPAMLLPWKFFKKVDGYGELYGGYYTQDEIRDIVQYAAVRCIDIIPEIDMPGHMGAACYC